MKKNTKIIGLISLYAALFIVLSIYGTIDLTKTRAGIKITVQNLPLFIGAITLGSTPGALIGFLGMFLNQMLTYGFTATTLFWVLPQTIVGAICGFLYESKTVKGYYGIKFWVLIVSLQLLLTILNTIVSLIDSLIFGYYSFITIFGPLAIRVMVSILTGIIYCVIIPIILNNIKKIH